MSKPKVLSASQPASQPTRQPASQPASQPTRQPASQPTKLGPVFFIRKTYLFHRFRVVTGPDFQK